MSASTALQDPTLQGQWEVLADRAVWSNPFQRPGVLGAALTHLGDVSGLRLLVVTRGDSLELALPLAPARRPPLTPGPAARTWSYSQSALGTPLLATRDPRVWQVALETLSRERGSPWASWVRLDQVDVGLAGVLAVAGRRTGRTVLALPPQGRALTRRREDGDYLSHQVSARSRAKLRRQRRRLAEHLGGAVEVVDLLQRDGWRAAVEQYVALEAAGWKGEDGGAFARNPHEKSWLLATAEHLDAADAVWIYGLVGADGTLAAAAIDLLDGDGVFTLKISYDERLADYSPGRLLEVEAFDRFHAAGLAWMDTCASPRNEAQNKQHAERRPLTTVMVQLGTRGNHGVASGVAVRAAYASVRARLVVRSVRRWWRTGGADSTRQRLERLRFAGPRTVAR